MMRRFLITSAAACAARAAGRRRRGATQINVSDDFFCPEEARGPQLSGRPSFHWSSAGGSINRHNIRQDDKLFFSGHATSGPINYSINASAGSFHYYCELHRFSGMSGVVKVRPRRRSRTRWPARFAVRWADSRHQHRLPLRRPLPGGPQEVEDLEERHAQVPGHVRAQRQASELQPQSPHVQDRGALGAQAGVQAQRLVARADAARLSDSAPLSGPCAGCGRRPASAAGRPRAAPSGAGRCGRRAGGRRRGPPGPGCGRRAATRSRASGPAPTRRA